MPSLSAVMSDESKRKSERIRKLKEENEQLRTKNNAYIQDIEVFKEENTHLKLENEQLKQIILFANELIRTQHITQHDYWKFRTVCKENGVDLE